MSTIPVSKGLLAGLAGVAFVAVLGLVFLLGRESNRSALKEPPKAVAAVEPAAAAAVAPAATPAPAEPGLTPWPPAPTPAPAATTSRKPALLQPGASPAPSNANREAILAYFKAVATIQPETSGDPDTAAQQVMAGLGKGDTSGFDTMVKQAQAARSRLAALTPPAPCAAYHQESLASLDGGLALMRDLQKAMTASDATTALSGFTDRANALKARSEGLQRQEAALKQRYCQ